MEKILVLDMGSRYTAAVARAVRGASVFSEIRPIDTPASIIAEENYKGIILAGGDDPAEDIPFDREIFALGIPMLGIGFGAEYMVSALGGTVSNGKPESGETPLVVDNTCSLFGGIESKTSCFINRERLISRVPTGFRITAKTELCPVAATENDSRKLFAVHFHPEISATREGAAMFKNFLYRICGCHTEWTPAAIIRHKIADICEQLDGCRAVLPLSGGVSSGVCAMLLKKAIDDRLICIHIDNGLLRKNEAAVAEHLFSKTHELNITFSNASPRFFGKLIGITEPAAKRKIAVEELTRVFAEESEKFEGAAWVSTDDCMGRAGFNSLIKSGENKVISPLSDLFPSEVRAIGLELGLPEAFLMGQHFPPEGLACRVIGEVSEESLSLLREADAILREEIRAAKIRLTSASVFAVLTDSKIKTIALRAVERNDFGELSLCDIKAAVLAKISQRIKAELPIARVVFDITTDKTEWE